MSYIHPSKNAHGPCGDQNSVLGFSLLIDVIYPLVHGDIL